MTSEEYFRARQVLLDALQALEPHLEALILVGAQAVYLHTGDSGLAVAPTTTDADLAIDAALLSDDPNLVSALAEAGFSLAIAPGTWKARDGVAVDLMVPEAQMANVRGRRGARLGVHGNTAARRTAGLEPALTDNTLVEIGSLRPEADTRSFTIKVAGPAALLVAKLTKMRERASTPQRLQAKDGLDVLRILQVVHPNGSQKRFGRLRTRSSQGTSPGMQSAFSEARAPAQTDSRPAWLSRRPSACRIPTPLPNQ